MLIRLFVAIILFTFSAFAEESANDASFCEKNPDSRVCKTGPEVVKEEKEALEQKCRYRPNTTECKAKKAREKAQKERIAFCNKNPKACAAYKR